MIEGERNHIIEVLKEGVKAIEENNIAKLKALSNQTIHSASIHQDKTSINLAISLYALSKIMDRSKGKLSIGKISTILKRMISSIEKREDNEFEKGLEVLLNLIYHLDRKFDVYVEDVVSQAKVRKGIAIYRHGITLGQVADLLNTSLWDLMSYLGNAKIDDEPMSPKTTIERLKLAEEIFR